MVLMGAIGNNLLEVLLLFLPVAAAALPVVSLLDADTLHDLVEWHV